MQIIMELVGACVLLGLLYLGVLKFIQTFNNRNNTEEKR